MFVTCCRRLRGFTLVEMAVSLSIACILLALGAPSISGYLQNARLGSMAQHIYGGLQTARAEAVKRNQNVEFVLTSSALSTTSFDAVVPNTTGRNWVVLVPASPSASAVLVEEKSSNDGDVGGVALAATGPSGASITFNSLGGTTSGGTSTIALTNPALGLCTPAGPVRCWSVVVTAGGQARICSPDPTLSPSDSRAC